MFNGHSQITPMLSRCRGRAPGLYHRRRRRWRTNAAVCYQFSPVGVRRGNTRRRHYVALWGLPIVNGLGDGKAFS